MDYYIKAMAMFILIFITSSLVGLVFWPENLGRAHKIMYSGYMVGWNKI